MPFESIRCPSCDIAGDGKSPSQSELAFHLAIDAIWFYK